VLHKITRSHIQWPLQIKLRVIIPALALLF
jgi:hypothetical protein